MLLSRPSRGAWIEISMIGMIANRLPGRAPRGARGLKSVNGLTVVCLSSVAPLAGRVD